MAGVKRQKMLKNYEDSPRFPEYYAKLNPNFTEQQCKEAAIKFRKSCNYQCIEYYEKKYPGHTYDEYVQMKKDAIYNKQKNNPTKIEYYQERYPELSLAEQKKLQKEYTSKINFQCIEYYTSRHPELSIEECEKLRQEAIKNYTRHRDQTGEHNGMHHSRTTKQKRRSISPRCIEFYETKYPELTHEEHQQLLQEFFENNRQRVINTVKDTNLEYYLQQGLSEEEAKIMLANRQRTFTLEKCISKYGEELGIQKFNERQEKWHKSLIKSMNSKTGIFESKWANDCIKQLCIYLNVKIQKSVKEKHIYDFINKQSYFYDFCYKNCIIEFDGDLWHANPKFYSDNFINPKTKKTSIEIRKHDKQKTECAINNGYSILRIWESDYKQNKTQVINKCISFLNENII